MVAIPGRFHPTNREKFRTYISAENGTEAIEKALDKIEHETRDMDIFVEWNREQDTYTVECEYVKA
jgi:hypothetical protein